MGLKNPFKLEKLKVKAFTSVKRLPTDAVGIFEAMFNPATFTQQHVIKYAKGQVQNSSGKKLDYLRSGPSELAIALLLDGTGVDEMGIVALLKRKTVAERVKEFLQLAYQRDGKIHEPHYLTVEWGDLKFDCRLGTAKISYSSFDRDGSSLRAQIDATFVSDEEVGKRMAKEDKSSPDLTHHRVVKAGDSLLTLTKQIYGSPEPYLHVAAANGLDDFRNLAPGLELVFPPLPTPGQEDSASV